MTTQNAAKDSTILDADAINKAAEEAAAKVGTTGTTEKAKGGRVKDESPKTIFYGQGEYAVTNKNIDGLIRDLKTFNETPTEGGKRQNVWKWKLGDVLGIKRTGETGKRFNEILETLDKSDPKQEELFDLMSEVEAEGKSVEEKK